MAAAIPVARNEFVPRTRSTFPLSPTTPAFVVQRLNLQRSPGIRATPLKKWVATMVGQEMRKEGTSAGTRTSLLVVGPGVLGSLVGRRWLQNKMGGRGKAMRSDSNGWANSGGETSGRGDANTLPRKTGSHKHGVVGNEGDDPFRILANGKKAYLDELDVLTLLVPPPFLKPMSTMNNYNHAAFLWKKIAAIPEERRHRLLDLLEPRHITAMWKMSELRYEDPGLYLEKPSRFLHSPTVKPLQPTTWTGQVNEVPWVFNFLSRFKKAFFNSGDGELYGRVITGGSLLERLGNVVAPLYFQVRSMKTIAASNEQCDFAFSYDEGHLELKNCVPNAFPQPGKHPWPFGNEFFDYVRVVGPGVVVGQSWFGPLPDKQDPKNPGVGPRKYLGEFVLIQNYENQIP